MHKGNTPSRGVFPVPEPVLVSKPETVPVLVSSKLVLKTPALQMSKSKEEHFSFTCRGSPGLIHLEERFTKSVIVEISPAPQGAELQRYWIGLQPQESPGNVSIEVLKVQTINFNRLRSVWIFNLFSRNCHLS